MHPTNKLARGPYLIGAGSPGPRLIRQYVLSALLLRLSRRRQHPTTEQPPKSHGPYATHDPKCPAAEDDETDFDESPDWCDLPEDDVLNAFDEDDLADEAPLDDWPSDDDEPSWFD